MKIYMASPGNQLQADAVRGQPVLVSFANIVKFKPIEKWMPSFSSVLIDSGAYSELNSTVKVDISAYAEWAESVKWADAWAGLDDINGDWRRSIRNYEFGGFPTYHDTDPPELLDDLIAMARERNHWIGIGIKPPRGGKGEWIDETLERIPDDIHIHGWACVAYADRHRFDTMDSTHWWREAMKYVTWMPWLTYGEALEIAVKKISRLSRVSEEGMKSERKLTSRLAMKMDDEELDRLLST